MCIEVFFDAGRFVSVCLVGNPFVGGDQLSEDKVSDRNKVVHGVLMPE